MNFSRSFFLVILLFIPKQQRSHDATLSVIWITSPFIIQFNRLAGSRHSFYHFVLGYTLHDDLGYIKRFSCIKIKKYLKNQFSDSLIHKVTKNIELQRKFKKETPLSINKIKSSKLMFWLFFLVSCFFCFIVSTYYQWFSNIRFRCRISDLIFHFNIILYNINVIKSRV